MRTLKLTTTAGLVTEPGDFARAEGSLLGANNCDLATPGVIAKRRGFESITLNGFSGSVYGIHSSVALDRYVGEAALLLEVADPNDSATYGVSFGDRDDASYTALTGASGTLTNVLTRRGKLAGIFTVTDACKHFAEYLRDRVRPAGGNDAA